MSAELTTLQVLQQARAKIEAPKNWIKGHMAKNRLGQIVEPGHPTACKFCMVGSLCDPAFRGPFKALYAALEKLGHSTRSGLVGFNDNDFTTHGQVLKVFDVAIEMETKNEHG